jgi:hypothetical protein
VLLHGHTRPLKVVYYVNALSRAKVEAAQGTALRLTKKLVRCGTEGLKCGFVTAHDTARPTLGTLHTY